MKKALIIAYQFPPMGGSGVQRTTKFVKYMRKFNYEPVVFTRKVENMQLKDETLLKEIPKDVKIIRTKAYDLTELPKGFNLLGKVIARKVLIPDGERIWQVFSKEEAVRIIKKENIDIFYTTSYPYSDHLLGLYLKDKFPNIPWVADFRDEWTNNPYLLDNPHYKIRMNIEKDMEKKIMKNADYLITNTPIMKDNFIKSYPFTKDKFHVIPNGFDELDFNELDEERKDNKKYTITYTGSFYGRRKPDVFFKACKELIDEGKIDKDKVQIKLIGNYIVKKLNEMIEENNLENIVDILPYMKHKKSIQKLLDSDALLLIVGPGPGAEAFYTGKIFEYMRTKRTILALVPENGVAADVVRETKTGYVADSRDLIKIKKILLKSYNEWVNKTNKLHPKEEKINEFDRLRLTEKLVDIFNKGI
ncbi:MAG: glycosyltransferase family 4 protein [Firmicutes bacterium]|nr:glycosyltransferase family 4 protein [Bacillota bacterium]